MQAIYFAGVIGLVWAPGGGPTFVPSPYLRLGRPGSDLRLLGLAPDGRIARTVVPPDGRPETYDDGVTFDNWALAHLADGVYRATCTQPSGHGHTLHLEVRQGKLWCAHESRHMAEATVRLRGRAGPRP